MGMTLTTHACGARVVVTGYWRFRILGHPSYPVFAVSTTTRRIDTGCGTRRSSDPLSVCQSVCLSVSLSVCLSVCMPVRLSPAVCPLFCVFVGMIVFFLRY